MSVHDLCYVVKVGQGKPTGWATVVRNLPGVGLMRVYADRFTLVVERRLAFSGYFFGAWPRLLVCVVERGVVYGGPSS